MVTGGSPCHYAPGEGKRKGENVAVAQCPASCGELIRAGSSAAKSWSPVRWTGTAPSRSRPGYREKTSGRCRGRWSTSCWPTGATPSAEPADPHHPALNDPGGQRDGQQHRRYRCHRRRHRPSSGPSTDEPTLARLCVALEPTDSTLFRQLTLFDHNTAATQIACPLRRRSTC